MNSNLTRALDGIIGKVKQALPSTKRKQQTERAAARCRRAAAILERTDSPTVVDGNAFMRVQKDYIEAFGADNYGMLRQHIDAHTRRGDGSLEADLATLILYTTMKYHLANKAK